MPANVYIDQCVWKYLSDFSYLSRYHLSWMSEHIRQDKISIREKVGAISIVEKMLESCIRWFDHV